MSDEEGTSEGKIVEGSAAFAAASTLAATGAVFKSSTSVGNQTWSVEYGQWELEVAKAAHNQKQEEEQQKHDLQEEKKDNDLRRNCFWLVVILLVVVLVVSAGVGIANNEQTTRQWSQNIVTTMIGGLLGSIAGYFTAKGSK